MVLTTHEKLALVTLRNALDAVRVAEQACMAADFGGVHVLGPLERIRAELAEVLSVVSDGVGASDGEAFPPRGAHAAR